MYEVGDRIRFRNTLGLEEILLVEQIASDGTMSGRGVRVKPSQVIEVIEPANG